MSAVLIAIGGNALVLDGEPGSIERQLERAASFAETVAELVADGWTVVVTHGNGPQVGFILRRGELVAPDASVEGLPNLPLWLAVADSQGGIGHMLAVALDTALDRAGLSSRAVAVLTHAEVALDDPAFQNPTKPIGGQISAEVARLRVAEEGWAVTEVEPDVFRRVVPSPDAPDDHRVRADPHSGRQRRRRHRRRRWRHPGRARRRGLASGGCGDRQGPRLCPARRRDRPRHPRPRHGRRPGIRRLQQADAASARPRRHRRDATPPRRRAVPGRLDGPESRFRHLVRRVRRRARRYHLAARPARRARGERRHPPHGRPENTHQKE